METIMPFIRDGHVYGIGSHGKAVKLIQSVLIDAGAMLVIDGSFGKLTESAVKAFQARNNLPADGYVGKVTGEALDAILTEISTPVQPISIITEAPWLAEMRAITGVKEIPGSQNSPIIMSWRSDIARAFPEMASYCAGYTGDEIPWCGFGLAACFARAEMRPAWGSEDTDKFMWADSWARWGTNVAKPVPGCIMVFTRNGGGHVSILERMVGDTAYIRGCNQSDMVNVAKKDMSTFKAARWPLGWPMHDILGSITNSMDTGSEV